MRADGSIVAILAVMILTLASQSVFWTHLNAENNRHLENETETKKYSPPISHLGAIQHPNVDPNVLGSSLINDLDLSENGSMISCGWFYDEVSIGGSVYHSEVRDNGYPSLDGFISIEDTNGQMDVFILNGSGYLRVHECEEDGRGGAYFMMDAYGFDSPLNLTGTPVTAQGYWVGHVTRNDTVDLLVRVPGSSARDMLLSTNGVIIVGDYIDNISFGLWNLSARKYTSVFAAELSFNGSWNWAAGAGGLNSTETAWGVTEDDDHVFIIGSYCMTSAGGQCTIDFGSHSITSVASSDIYVAALNKLTTQWDWVRSAGSSGYDDGKAIELGDDGHLYLGGNYRSSISIGLASLSNAGNDDVFIASMDTNGSWRWALGGGGNGHENVEDIAVFNQTVVVGGSHCISQSFCSSTFGSTTIPSNGYSDVFFASATTSGDWIQANGGGGSSSRYRADSATAVAYTNDAQLLVAGHFESSATFGTTSLTGYSGRYSGFIWTLFGDSDGDGVADGDDNCLTVSNPLQLDYDGDGKGNTCDDDDDDDGIPDDSDYCTHALLNWTSNQSTDYDSDGCQDAHEDSDDDGDGVLDITDLCQKGLLDWSSDETTDNDRDGCHDDVEDEDDDHDTILDDLDKCPRGKINWFPVSNNDHDSDGCMDSTEDGDDDDDGILDEPDLCSRGMLTWKSSPSNDFDSDGCRDSDEDDDDDNDTIPDWRDSCPTGSHGWVYTPETDHDQDGCHDHDGDGDDDDDGIPDEDDRCAWGRMGWTSNARTDFDGDGCEDREEDDDDDGDGVQDDVDSCPKSEIGWVSNSRDDADGDGCVDEPRGVLSLITSLIVPPSTILILALVGFLVIRRWKKAS